MSSPLLSAPAISPDAGSAEQARRDMENRLAGLGNLSGKRLDPEARAKKLREACEGFESVFIQKMWQEMRNTLPKGGLLHGREERFWQDMYDQELAKKMTSAGGIGLADMMFAQLSRNLGAASRETASGGAPANFTPQAAPLVQGCNLPPAQPVSGPAPATGLPARADDNPGSAGYSGTLTAAAAQNQAPGTVTTSAPAQGQMPMEPADEAKDSPNPVVEQALASIRAQQAMRQQAAQATAKAHAGSRAPLNGIEMAQLAKRDAGDKLGSRAIRPPLHKPASQRSHAMPGPDPDGKSLIVMQSAAPAPQSSNSAQSMSMPESAADPLVAESAQTVQRTAQTRGPVIRRIRRTTNIPPQNRIMNNGQQPVRMLNADGTTHGSRAGAGIAAYHQARTLPANSISPLEPSSIGAGRPGAPAQDNGAFDIPPLTPGSING